MNGGHAKVRPLLQVSRLSVRFARRDRVWARGSRFLLALDRVSFEIMPGEVLGVVGESGSGKTTLARAVAGLIKPESGAVVFDGVDITQLPERKLRGLRRRFQLVFQDPYSALDPRMTVAESLAEPLEIHFRGLSAREKTTRVSSILEQVGLSSPVLPRYPHELSGGQCQRVAIARALITQPELLICDEPTSALDASVQAQILNLLAELRIRCNLTYLFITHDIPVVAYIADRLLVMYHGRVVETGPTYSVLSTPLHPYTKLLVHSIPGVGRIRAIPMHPASNGVGASCSTAGGSPFTQSESAVSSESTALNQPGECGDGLIAPMSNSGGTAPSESPIRMRDSMSPVVLEPSVVPTSAEPGAPQAEHWGSMGRHGTHVSLERESRSSDGTAGCAFAPRCALKMRGLCERATPELVEVSPAHHVACHALDAEPH